MLFRSQIDDIHDVFTPKKEEIEQSLRIIQAAQDSGIKDGGVIKLDGKMVDIPVIQKAERIVKLAKAAGIL